MHRRWVLWIFPTLAFCLACCSAPQPLDLRASRNTPAETRKYQDIVTHLADPAMEGRGPGTAGLDRARDYLVAQFQAIGLQPTVTPADATHDSLLASSDAPPRIGSYLQDFEIKLTTLVKTQSLELLDPDGHVVGSAQPGTDFNTLGFSPNAQFVGQAVFAGYGVVNENHQYNSYQNDDADPVQGKVVIVYRYEPQSEDGKSYWARHSGGHSELGTWSAASRLTTKAHWAAQRGTVALLVVNPPSQDVGGLKSTASTGGFGASDIPVIHISSVWFAQLLEKAGYDPVQTMRDPQTQADRGLGGPTLLKGLTLRGHVSLEHPRTRVANVVAMLPGAGKLADEVVVIGAHYDHLGYGEFGSLAQKTDNETPTIHPGADDNASGTAGLLTLARWMTQRIHTSPSTAKSSSRTESNIFSSGARSGGGRRTLLFVAFTAEERGILGSAHLMRNLQDLNLKESQIKAMLNMDMIGRMQGNRLYVMGTETSSQWKKLVDTAAHNTGLEVRYSKSPVGGSDHIIFQFHRIPALHFFTGIHPDYHRPSDTADKINSKDAVRALAVIEHLLTQLWTQPEPITFATGSLPDTSAGMGDPAHGDAGPRAYLGVLPDYASLDGDQGCALSGVLPASPAEAAGLKPGDLLVRWNGTVIHNVKDLSTALKTSKPGQLITLTVRRQDQSITLTATLGQR